MAGKGKIVQFRVSEEEMVRLSNAASNAGWTMTEYCRRRVLPEVTPEICFGAGEAVGTIIGSSGRGMKIVGVVSDPDGEAVEEAKAALQGLVERKGRILAQKATVTNCDPDYIRATPGFKPLKGCKSPDKCSRKGASCDVCRAG